MRKIINEKNSQRFVILYFILKSRKSGREFVFLKKGTVGTVCDACVT
jgi:hypothetical protein